MKLKSIIIPLALLLASSAACEKTEESAPPSDTPTPHETAIRLYEDSSLSKAIKIQEKAIDLMRKGKSKESGFAVLSQMGFFQCRAGNYMEGLRFLQEAEDSLQAKGVKDTDAENAVKFLGNISNLYTRFGLYDEAIARNNEAIDLAARHAAGRLPDLWRMRSTIYEYMQQHQDSQLFCLRKALKINNEVKDEKLYDNSRIFNECSKAWFFIENPDFAPDSIPLALSTLEKYLESNRHMLGTNLLLAGRAHVLLGHTGKGLPMMEKGIDFFRTTQDGESLEWGLQKLALSYAAARDPKLFDIYSEASAMHDSILKRQRNDVMLGKDFQYRTSELKSENRLLETQITANRQRTLFLSLIAILVVAIAVIILYYRQRQHKRILLQKEENIKSLISERIALNTRIETLNSRLGVILKKEEPSDIILNPVLLEKDDEKRFRNNFMALHPGFIERLRTDYPGITAGNELLCMLIALGMDNEEMALALGISRESLVTARYRLRSRFRLPKETDLNNFIRAMVKD